MSSVPAVALSAMVHVGILALAATATGHWQPAEPREMKPAPARETAMMYIAVGPPAPPPGDPAELTPPAPPAPVRPAPAPRIPRPPSVAVLAELFKAATPAVLPVASAPPQLTVRTEGVKPVPAPPAPQPVPAPTPPVTASAGARAGGGGDRIQHGTTTTAELLTRAGNACPALHVPANWESDEIEVAVAFVVDTLGQVDRGTLRVVQPPDGPKAKPEFFPHIYVVGTSPRGDPRIHQAAMTQGSAATVDVLRHVAALRFRPAMRNGRPTPSSVLVSCQVALR